MLITRSHGSIRKLSVTGLLGANAPSDKADTYGPWMLVTKKSQKGNIKTGTQASGQISQAARYGNMKGQNMFLANSFSMLQNVEGDFNHEDNNGDIIRNNGNAFSLRHSGESSPSGSQFVVKERNNYPLSANQKSVKNFQLQSSRINRRNNYLHDKEMFTNLVGVTDKGKGVNPEHERRNNNNELLRINSSGNG